MKMKPKNAAGKRNHGKIYFVIQQPLLKKLREKQSTGCVLSLLSDPQLVAIAEIMTKVVMRNEDITICLKRKKRC
jgi:hypothetical protein